MVATKSSGNLKLENFSAVLDRVFSYDQDSNSITYVSRWGNLRKIYFHSLEELVELYRQEAKFERALELLMLALNGKIFATDINPESIHT